ncbi:MAG: hypothetical protein P0Y64_01175 [Candidatus Sphingomonas colombiensis]|nr:hypothetical protein [Sphingomonas sp.]WEK43483.1 MAG: hypothetical protein P0Y64_01175 [Sphingomonas sp.]
MAAPGGGGVVWAEASAGDIKASAADPIVRESNSFFIVDPRGAARAVPGRYHEV